MEPGDIKWWHSDDACHEFARNAHPQSLIKSVVTQTQLAVFGYSCDVIPDQFKGDIVVKPEISTYHGKAVEGPILKQKGMVYQRLLHGQEYRIAVIGKDIVFTKQYRHRDSTGMPKNQRIRESSIYNVPPEEVVSEAEYYKLLDYTEALILEYCEMDAIRDEDGKLYIIDCQTVVGKPSPYSFKTDDLLKIIPHEASLWEKNFSR